MEHDSAKYRRRSIRLRDYDYGQQGAYGVTICTQNRELYFENGSIAEIAERCWIAIPQHFPMVELDEWVLMPNHLHGILVIISGNDIRRGVQLNAPTPLRNSANKYSEMSPPRNTLGLIVRTYKAAVTTRCRRESYNYFSWQRNYYERIIRDEAHLNRVRQYIISNPAKWAEDIYNPTNSLGKEDL